MTRAEDKLRAGLASLATFQTWVGAGDASEAEESIWHDALPAPADGEIFSAAEFAAYWPYALIASGDEDSLSLDHAAAPDTWLPSGSLLLQFERVVDDVDVAALNDLVDRQFKESIVGILEELLDTVNNPLYLGFDSIRTVYGPWREELEEQSIAGDLQTWTFRLTFGASQGGG